MKKSASIVILIAKNATDITALKRWKQIN